MKTLGITAIALILFIACSHEDDTDKQPPLMVLDQPQEGDIYKTGDTFHMQMSLSDNENLKECQLTILPDSIESGHKSPLHGGAWEVSRTFSLSGMSFSIDEHMEVPDSVDQEPIAHGRYIYRLRCTDQAGNLSTSELKFFLEE